MKRDIAALVATHFYLWFFDTIVILLNIWAMVFLGGIINFAAAFIVSLYMVWKIREIVSEVPLRAIHVPLKQ